MSRPNLQRLSSTVPTIPAGSPSAAEYMTAGEIAQRYHVSRATAYRYLDKLEIIDCAIKCTEDHRRLWAGRSSRIHQIVTQLPDIPPQLRDTQRQRHAAYVRWYGHNYREIYGSHPSQELEEELPEDTSGSSYENWEFDNDD